MKALFAVLSFIATLLLFSGCPATNSSSNNDNNTESPTANLSALIVNQGILSPLFHQLFSPML